LLNECSDIMTTWLAAAPRPRGAHADWLRAADARMGSE
jgi:hypothetical protein